MEMPNSREPAESQADATSVDVVVAAAAAVAGDTALAEMEQAEDCTAALRTAEKVHRDL